MNAQNHPTNYDSYVEKCDLVILKLMVNNQVEINQEKK